MSKSKQKAKKRSPGSQAADPFIPAARHAMVTVEQPGPVVAPTTGDGRNAVINARRAPGQLRSPVAREGRRHVAWRVVRLVAGIVLLLFGAAQLAIPAFFTAVLHLIHLAPGGLGPVLGIVVELLLGLGLIWSGRKPKR